MKVSKLETKFKDLNYEIGLRKSVQQQFQREMGELDHQAKENVARPMFDVAKLISKDSAQQHQGRAFLELLRQKQHQVDFLERGSKFIPALECPADFLQADRSAIIAANDISRCVFKAERIGT